MNQTILLYCAGACISTMLIAAGSHAGELHPHRAQTSHVHGTAAMNIVADGPVIHIELTSPAANLVGFEYAPVSESEHTAHENALSTLKNADQLFHFNETARCRAAEVEIMSGSTPAAHSTDHEAHRHHDADGGEHADMRHSDITAMYQFNCDAPGKLDTLHVGLFDAFPAIDNLNVQYITEGRQGASTLNSGQPILAF